MLICLSTLMCLKLSLKEAMQEILFPLEYSTTCKCEDHEKARPLGRSPCSSQGAVDILQKYPVPECDIWFIKFSCDFHYNSAAIGNREGKKFVWELQSSPPGLIARLSHAQCKSPIRQTAMSFDGSTILSCCEDGSIWRWDTVS
ncbi:polycomb group protein FIE2 [Canna indica]|uniref:Polycomb group protein FIE2 n=1 Tax=Canna indica TaxID=4628 RepID=A0AAQ3KZX1_9LILI|nr:polycomb group protein FIE2 [Canna indica]